MFTNCCVSLQEGYSQLRARKSKEMNKIHRSSVHRISEAFLNILPVGYLLYLLYFIINHGWKSNIQIDVILSLTVLFGLFMSITSDF